MPHIVHAPHASKSCESREHALSKAPQTTQDAKNSTLCCVLCVCGGMFWGMRMLTSMCNATSPCMRLCLDVPLQALLLCSVRLCTLATRCLQANALQGCPQQPKTPNTPKPRIFKSGGMSVCAAWHSHASPSLAPSHQKQNRKFWRLRNKRAEQSHAFPMAVLVLAVECVCTLRKPFILKPSHSAHY